MVSEFPQWWVIISGIACVVFILLGISMFFFFINLTTTLRQFYSILEKLESRMDVVLDKTEHLVDTANETLNEVREPLKNAGKMMQHGANLMVGIGEKATLLGWGFVFAKRLFAMFQQKGSSGNAKSDGSDSGNNS